MKLYSSIKDRICYCCALLLCFAVFIGNAVFLISGLTTVSSLFIGILCFVSSAAIMVSVRIVYFIAAKKRSIFLEIFSSSDKESVQRLILEKRLFRFQLYYRLITGILAMGVDFIVVVHLSKSGDPNMLLTAVIVFLAMEHFMNTKKFGDRYRRISEMKEESYCLEELNAVVQGDLRWETTKEVNG